MNLLKSKKQPNISFPYHSKRIKEGFIPDPLVNIEVETPHGYLNIQFLLDSGADITVLPINPYAQLFNFVPQKEESVSIQGIGRSVTAYPAILKFRIANKVFPVRCYFASTRSMPILGRLDWWDKFSFTFNNHRKHTEITAK